MRTNLHCHNCGGYFDVDFNTDINKEEYKSLCQK